MGKRKFPGVLELFSGWQIHHKKSANEPGGCYGVHQYVKNNIDHLFFLLTIVTKNIGKRALMESWIQFYMHQRNCAWRWIKQWHYLYAWRTSIQDDRKIFFNMGLVMQEVLLLRARYEENRNKTFWSLSIYICWLFKIWIITTNKVIWSELTNWKIGNLKIMTSVEEKRDTK